MRCGDRAEWSGDPSSNWAHALPTQLPTPLPLPSPVQIFSVIQLVTAATRIVALDEAARAAKK